MLEIFSTNNPYKNGDFAVARSILLASIGTIPSKFSLILGKDFWGVTKTGYTLSNIQKGGPESASVSEKLDSAKVLKT